MMSCLTCLSHKGDSDPQTLTRYQTWVKNSAGGQLFLPFNPLVEPHFTMKKPRAGEVEITCSPGTAGAAAHLLDSRPELFPDCLENRAKSTCQSL